VDFLLRTTRRAGRIPEGRNGIVGLKPSVGAGIESKTGLWALERSVFGAVVGKIPGPLGIETLQFSG
jgi:hypothetical protein